MRIKAIAANILKFGAIALGYGQAVASLTPTDKDDKVVAIVKSDLELFELAVIDAQVASDAIKGIGDSTGLSGEQRAAIASKKIGAIVIASYKARGMKMRDEAEFDADIQKLAGALYDISNDFE